MDELVFAVPVTEIRKLLTYNEPALIPGDSDTLKMLVRKGLFRERNLLEEDPSFKQIIPYAVISNKDSYYLFRRRSGQTEKRLQNLLSLGIGGHMNPGGKGISEEQFLLDELNRELSEEVRLTKGCHIEEIEFIGFILDDSIPVSRVHMGLLYNVKVSNKEVYVNETDKLTAEWVDKADLHQFYEGMETWTRIVVDQYINRKD
jgi:predicted NUDIX family phosphoesterase